MIPSALLRDIRELYLKQFQDERQTLEDNGERLVIEPLLLKKDGVAVREGRLKLPLRGDLYSIERGLVRIDSNKLFTFNAFDITSFGRTKIVVSPFHWDSCRLVWRGLSPRVADDAIAKWFLAWIDMDDQKPVATSGFKEVVHFASDPEENSGEVRMDCDFGSAPIEAFETLLESLVALMPSELAVSMG